MRYDISNISLGPEGAILEFLDPYDDVRSNGMTARHQLFVPDLPEVADELEDLFKAAETLLKKARVAYLEATPGPGDLPEPVEPDYDLQGPAPYDNPEDFDEGR